MNSRVDISPDELALTAARKLINQRLSSEVTTLRLYIEGKGCDGFYYGVCFDAENAEDLSLEFDGEPRVRFIVDPKTLEFLAGSQVTWVDDDRGRGFLIENPKQKSFRGKFFTRSKWREKFV